MRIQALFIIVVINVAVAAEAKVTAADLVGKWFRHVTAEAPTGFDIVFRADHSFDYVGGDAHGAGKWKLHGGKKLELIYHYDYDRKPISNSSPRQWILIESLSKGRMQVRWYSWEYNKDVPPAANVKPLTPQVWTKQRSRSNQSMQRPLPY